MSEPYTVNRLIWGTADHCYFLQLKYKARDYSTQVALTKKDIVKANSKVWLHVYTHTVELG